MYLYTEFPNFDTNRILWYLLRNNFELLNQHLISWKTINKIKIGSLIQLKGEFAKKKKKKK
jgi:hypothetical protein